MSFTNFPNGVTSFGVPIVGGPSVPILGNTYWVKKSTDTDYAEFCKRYKVTYSVGNKVTQSVYSTVDEVFAAAGKHDRIIFMPPDSGGHDMTTAITISSTQYGLKIFGYSSNGQFTQNTTIKNPTTSDSNNMFIIKTDKVEIAGLCFQNRKAGACIIIGDATSGAGTAIYQTHIHDCNFTDYGGVATYGISPGALAGAANDQCDAVNLVVENCYFDGFVTAAIVVNGTRSAYRNNQIKTGAGGAASGIKIYSSTSSRGGVTIEGNYIWAPDTATTICILVSNIGHAAGTFHIIHNYCEGGTAGTQPITKMTYLNGGDNWYHDANGQAVYIDLVA